MSPGRRRLAVVALFVAAIAIRVSYLPLGEPLTWRSDLDGLSKLWGIDANPSPAAAVGYFFGDDPQQDHSFRPLASAMLWAEWHVWGYRRLPYQLMNVAWLAATAVLLTQVGRACGWPAWAGVLSALLLLVQATVGSRGATNSIATRHDLTCSFFALAAYLALIRYLDTGGGRYLRAMAICSLLAYLSKEMALALLPLSALTVWLLPRDGDRPERRRRLAALGTAVLMAAIWFAWYQYARAHMTGSKPGHSFADLWQRVQTGHLAGLLQFVYVLCWPIGDTIRQMVAVELTILVWTPLFWRAAIGTVVAVLMGVLFWQRQRRCLVIVYLWKVCCDLPVLPLHDTWPWYQYMPHVLDPLLSGALATVAWTQWQQRRAGQSAKACSSAQLENACCGESPEAGTPTTRTP